MTRTTTWRHFVDADGLTTRLAHDFAGHRVAIERAGRTWTYGYDLNGNLVSETPPHTGA